jgi:hypothetical protein
MRGLIVTTSDINLDLEEAITGIIDSVELYELARSFDNIDLWSEMRDSRLGVTLRQAGIEFDPNFCSVVIDAVANRLEITGVTATTEASDTSVEATAAINNIWDANQLTNYLPVWHRNALRDGDAYLVAWPSEFADSVDADAASSNSDVEMIETTDVVERPTMFNITYVDPCHGRMFYDSENPRVKRFFAQCWNVAGSVKGKPRRRVNLLYSDRIEKYISKDGTSGDQTDHYEEFIEPADLLAYEDALQAASNYNDVSPAYPWPIPNPYAQIPAFHLRTDLEYGKPEHRNAFALQDALSRIMEVMMVTVNFQGWPQAYALQQAESLKSQSIMNDPTSDSSPETYEDADFGPLINPNIIPEVDGDTETGSRITMSPGSIALLKGFSEIGQLSAANPTTLLEPWREIARAISATTDTPLYKFQGLGGDAPSGESLKIVEAPLNKKSLARARLFGTDEQMMLEFILRLMGFEGVHVEISWANPATTDILDVWQLVELKVRLGVPRYVAFMQAGVPETQAREWSDMFNAQQQAVVAPSATT